MAEKSPNLLRTTAWAMVGVMSVVLAEFEIIKLIDPVSQSAVVAKVNSSGEKPPVKKDYGTVSPERITAFIDSYSSRIIRLEKTVPMVNTLETKACGRKLVKPKQNTSTTRPNYSLTENIMSHDRKIGYQLSFIRQSGAVVYLDLDQGVVEGCVGMSPADQDINFEKYGQDWLMQVDYTDRYGAAETYRDYETAPNSANNALTPRVFDRYMRVSSAILENASQQKDLGPLHGYPR